jgi:hypothetical protein
VERHSTACKEGSENLRPVWHIKTDCSKFGFKWCGRRVVQFSGVQWSKRLASFEQTLRMMIMPVGKGVD